MAASTDYSAPGGKAPVYTTGSIGDPSVTSQLAGAEGTHTLNWVAPANVTKVVATRVFRTEGVNGDGNNWQAAQASVSYRP